MRLSIFLLSWPVIGVMGVLPTQTIFGFLASRFLVMDLPPDCTLCVRRALRALPRFARHRYTRGPGLATFLHKPVSASRNDLRRGVPDRPVLRRNQRSRRRGLPRPLVGRFATTLCPQTEASPYCARWRRADRRLGSTGTGLRRGAASGNVRRVAREKGSGYLQN